MADFCENHENHGKVTTSNYGPRDYHKSIKLNL